MHGYTHGCRCAACIDRHAATAAAWRDRNAAEPITGTEPWHGTDGGYTNHGCRSECCRSARRQYRAHSP